MAVSTISGDFGVVRQMSVILKEGNITIGTGFDFMGSSTGTVALATGLEQGEWVALSDDTGNTYDATGGLPVVCTVANNNDLVIGRIIDTPRWVKIPATSQTTWATMLAGGYYRVATIEVFPMLVGKATLVTANAAAIVPGTVGTLDVDVSGSAGVAGLVVNDIASGGSNYMFSFHYAAQAEGATVSLMIGMTGFGTAAT